MNNALASQIRCIFRVAEFAGGYDSLLATSEGYFWLLDALPLWVSDCGLTRPQTTLPLCLTYLCSQLGMSLYCLLWPARCIGGQETAHNAIKTVYNPNSLEMGSSSYAYEAKR